MSVGPTPVLVLLLASMGRTAAAQAPDEYAAPDLRVEGQVAYRAATEPAANGPGWFETVVYIRATSTEGAKLEYGGCPFTIQVFDTPTRNGRPRWDDRDVPNAICTTELTIARLRQGQVDTLRALLPPADVLSDSLGSGRYYVGALVCTNHDTLVIEAGTLDLHP